MKILDLEDFKIEPNIGNFSAIIAIVLASVTDFTYRLEVLSDGNEVLYIQDDEEDDILGIVTPGPYGSVFMTMLERIGARMTERIEEERTWTSTI